MAKQTRKKKTKNSKKITNKGIENKRTQLVNAIRRLNIANATSVTSRSSLQQYLNPGKDINYECGYPDTISSSEYKGMYDREGIPERVVNLFPDESWNMPPDVYEDKTPKETDFEKDWKELLKEKNIYDYLARIDRLSGIGRYGILLVGLDDGKRLSEPVDGIEEMVVSGQFLSEIKILGKERRLLYLKAFDETNVTIKVKEHNTAHPRFGFPTIYGVTFEEENSKKSVEVHWTRVLHVADNRGSSEIYGKPRMMSVYNRLLDIRKVLSGSGEMFWKGAFPGYALNMDSEVTLSDDEKTELKQELEDYQQSLQRYMILGGIDVKSLSPQVADPKPHLEGQLRFIAITLGIPYRVLVGSEQSQLASSQDIRTWNKRVARRQNGYLTQWVIRPFIDMMIAYGVVSQPEEYFVVWPDLNTPAEEDMAKVILTKTDALAKYVSSDVDMIIPKKEYLTIVMGFTDEEADAIMDSLDEHIGAMDEEDEKKAMDDRKREDEAADKAQKGKVELEVVKQSGKKE